MGFLLAIPIWVVVLDALLKPNVQRKANQKAFMLLCSIALILIMGLRSQYTGSNDTRIYFHVFDMAKGCNAIHPYLKQMNVLDGGLLFSEVGFYLYTWISAQILPNAQWFLVISSTIIVAFTSYFIWHNSEDYSISWLVFICLGSMIFAMNGMRQAIAMAICLFSYEYAKRKKFISFLLVVLVAILFHKSALFFIIVYFVRNMKFNIKSLLILTTGIMLFFVFANRLAFLYDSMTGEDYFSAESFESGGVITILIYIIAIILAFLANKRLYDTNIFAALAIVILGLVIYLSRFVSTQIYERMSYYFFSYLMILFPATFKAFNPRDRILIKVFFVVFAFVLFTYRISKGAFAGYRLFW